jgi:hypothetical protein
MAVLKIDKEVNTKSQAGAISAKPIMKKQIARPSEKAGLWV